MSTVEERLAYLEGRAQEHSHVIDDFREVGNRLERRMDGLEQRMDGLAARIDAVDQKVDRFREELSGRIDALESKFDKRFAGIDARFTALDDKLSRVFVWVVGVQVTVLLAVVGTVLQLAL